MVVRVTAEEMLPAVAKVAATLRLSEVVPLKVGAVPPETVAVPSVPLATVTRVALSSAAAEVRLVASGPAVAPTCCRPKATELAETVRLSRTVPLTWMVATPLSLPWEVPAE